ncbi:MAG: serine hydrolase domain-containing protein [Gaiella sp.]|uniref:serine hydrolase domain-containing protein n=1 Tax=Gaiella sp. TaxID=2663207 RepID=UPI003C72784C
MSLPDGLAGRLERLVATAQSEQRIPSVSAAVFRDGDVLWRAALGSADVERGEDATPAHAYRIGSITKTFTAVCILQLRDAMVLDLDDPLRTHIPEAPPGPTVADALSHLSGFQREPPGEIWETMTPPTREELLGGLEDAERVLRPGEAWHYSNLAFGLLGEIVARRNEGEYAPALRARVLEPLGLTRTGFDPQSPSATGYFVDPYSDRVTVEPDPAVEGPVAAMGWLWSTVDDLARWADFLATGHDGVLSRETLDEMARARTMADQGAWKLGWGLGLELYRRGDRVFAGHGGAMPGFLAGVCIHRPERTGAAVLCNTSAGAGPEKLALDLAEAVLDELPRAPEPWRPDGGAPDDVTPLLGRWWSEGYELVLSWQGGRLRLEVVDGPPGRSISWLRQEGDDRWRIEEGRELGELLRVVRDENGALEKLYVATYPLTRAPTAFADASG